MNCPKCNHDKTTIADTRYKTKSKLRRRRVCQKCKYKFTTIEMYIGASHLNKLINELKSASLRVNDSIKLMEGIDVDI